MKRFAQCSAEGEIESTYLVSEAVVDEFCEAIEGAQLIPISDDVTEASHWFDGLTLRPKQKFSLFVSKSVIVADGKDASRVSGIPLGTKLECATMLYTVDDGEVEFSVDRPGQYTLIFEAAAYLREEVHIEAVAAT
jgi:hypothetical protein